MLFSPIQVTETGVIFQTTAYDFNHAIKNKNTRLHWIKS